MKNEARVYQPAGQYVPSRQRQNKNQNNRAPSNAPMLLYSKCVRSPLLPNAMLPLRYDDQQHQNDYEDDNRRQAPILLGLARKRRQPPRRPVKLALVPVDSLVHLVQHVHLVVQLIPNLYAQLPLPAYALAQPVQLLVLLPYDARVVLVDLLVVQVGLVGALVLGLVLVGCVAARRRRRLRVGRVGEADGLALGPRLGLGKVGGQGRVVGFGEGGGC